MYSSTASYSARSAGVIVDDDVADVAGGDRGVEQPRLVVEAQQLAGVAGHQVADRAEPAEDLQGGLAGRRASRFRGMPLWASRRAFRTLLAGQRGRGRHDLADPASSTGPNAASTSRNMPARNSSSVWPGLPDGELEVVGRSRPCSAAQRRRQAEQVEQVPDLDGVDLHRRRGQQDERLRLVLEPVHEPQEPVRAALLGRPGASAAGVVGLVEHDQVPVLGLRAARRPGRGGASGGWSRGPAPPCATRRARPSARGGPEPAVGLPPDELLAVVDRDVEVELLVQLVLPLGQHRRGDHQQDAPGQPREPRLADQQAGGDRLAQARPRRRSGAGRASSGTSGRRSATGAARA